jgi:N-terminal phage replisome organiser (Phage_rep_org_N)
MSDTMSAMSTKQYRPSRRSWVKLWVNEWLTGSVRWQLTPQQRSMWADLLALAGNSRFPGVICSGDTNGVLEPFPMDYLCGVFRCKEADVRAAFDLFLAQGRVTINETGVIRIVNWDKYQSEYQLKRQRRQYNEPHRSDGEPNVHRKSRKTPPEEVEVEGEVEKKESTAFALFWSEYPRQEKELRAKYAWFKEGLEERSAEVMASLLDWKKSEQWSDPKYVPYAVNWIQEGLWKRNPVNEARKSKHEQKREITKSAVERVRAQIENS